MYDMAPSVRKVAEQLSKDALANLAVEPIAVAPAEVQALGQRSQIGSASAQLAANARRDQRLMEDLVGEMAKLVKVTTDKAAEDKKSARKSFWIGLSGVILALISAAAAVFAAAHAATPR
jgi:hypothetical protein